MTLRPDLAGRRAKEIRNLLNLAVGQWGKFGQAGTNALATTQESGLGPFSSFVRHTSQSWNGIEGE